MVHTAASRNKQAELLLTLLGYTPGPVNGAAEPKTLDALKQLNADRAGHGHPFPIPSLDQLALLPPEEEVKAAINGLLQRGIWNLNTLEKKTLQAGFAALGDTHVGKADGVIGNKTLTAAEHYKDKNPSWAGGQQTAALHEANIPLTASERDLLIKTVYLEATKPGQKHLDSTAAHLDQAGIAHVVRNRMESPESFREKEKTVTGIIKAENAFEPWLSHKRKDTNKRLGDLRKSTDTYEDIGEVVDGVFKGTIPDVTGGATFFANAGVVAQRVEHKNAKRGHKKHHLPEFMRQYQGSEVTIGQHTYYAGDPEQAKLALALAKEELKASPPQKQPHDADISSIETPDVPKQKRKELERS